jgi:hypothetical protein
LGGLEVAWGGYDGNARYREAWCAVAPFARARDCLDATEIWRFYERESVRQK